MTILRRLVLGVVMLAVSLLAGLCGSVPLLDDFGETVPVADAHIDDYYNTCSGLQGVVGPGTYACHSHANNYNVTSDWVANCSVQNGATVRYGNNELLKTKSWWGMPPPVG